MGMLGGKIKKSFDYNGHKLEVEAKYGIFSNSIILFIDGAKAATRQFDGGVGATASLRCELDGVNIDVYVEKKMAGHGMKVKAAGQDLV